MNKGFTLLELVVVFSIIVTISTIGLVSFVSYSRSQALSTATSDFVTFLYSAKSRAQSQVKPKDNLCDADQSNLLPFEGYGVGLCKLSPSSCNQKEVDDKIDYALYLLCGGKKVLSVSKNLSGNVVQFDTDNAQTTTKYFTFNPISGIVSGGGYIRLCLVSDCSIGKRVKIDQIGNISVQ